MAHNVQGLALLGYLKNVKSGTGAKFILKVEDSD
jgi:hypothetical protein